MGLLIMGFDFTEMQQKSNGGTEQVCRALESRLPADLLEHFQIIPTRIGKLDKDKIRIYFIHDLPGDPETLHMKVDANRERFHKIVFCGQWQYNQYLLHYNLKPNEKMAVIDTPIIPFDEIEKDDEKIRLVYTSTPQRGLEILVPVFEKLCEKHDNLELHVFSSFEIYGWKDSDKPFQALFDKCKNHPNIVYHGFQPNEVVREYVAKAHIFAYPSIWQECNSRALIEAMSACCVAVHPNYAGLSDTSGSLTQMYQYCADHNVHANIFYNVLDNAIKTWKNEEFRDKLIGYLKFTKAYADTRFDINKITNNWEAMLRSLLMQYPTPESRHFNTAKEFFSFKTS